MAFIGINLATGALARVSDSEAQWKRALNQAWSKLTAEQREELSPEQRSWVKWKNTLPDKEREKVTKDARRISCLCGTGTKDRLRKGAFYDKRHLASRLCHNHLDGFQQKAAGAQGAKERIRETTGDDTLRRVLPHTAVIAGEAVGLIHDIPSAQDVIERVVREASALITQWPSKTPA